MGKFFVATRGPENWKNLLAQPDKHWKSGFSAKTLAHCWEEADGFPESVNRAFSLSELDNFTDVEFLLAIPEYKVPLPGGARPSQNDIFVLAKSNGHLISIAVEGKVAESFGPTVSEWQKSDSRGKRKRLKYLCALLGLSEEMIGSIRYQLLHRTASALIEAERFNARSALMLVHSFSQAHEHFVDYDAFLQLFGKSGRVNAITQVGDKNGVDLYLAWVTGEERFLEI